MSEFSISITADNTIKYPLHSHNAWEVMLYLEGEGFMLVGSDKLPFKKGTVIIMPPKTEHGSVSVNGFKNISVAGDFSHIFMFKSPICLTDNTKGEGEILAKLILANRHGDENYLQALCNAYAYFLAENTACDSQLGESVKKIISAIEDNFCDTEFSVATILKNSGYAEDYIRAEFRAITGLSPVKFLNKLRIERATSLLEIYGNGIRISELSETVGFTDVTYFTKQFKKITGTSPTEYKNKLKG
ncbi:MAG: helix-turn-helix domain-containing protein [Clostridia bacterium]|nr:helix-turn-helix domain-containing protein [Clostridia bacterium]